MVNVGKYVFRFLGFGAKGAVSKAAEQSAAVTTVNRMTQRMTRSIMDPLTGLETLEREITYKGAPAICRIENLADGKRKISITGGGDNPMWRTKKITVEENGSIWGGKKITITKDDTKYWCYGENSTLIKEYDLNHNLQHKEFSMFHNSGNGLNDYGRNATQDLVYNEYPLTSSVKDMLQSPYENRYIKHSLGDKNNYSYFVDGSATNYSKAVAAREQALIDAAKKAEAEALAAKEAAEKAAAELKAKQPRINIAKMFNKDVNELTVKETTLANGTIEREFSDPVTGKLLAKTQDLGIGHKEWIYGGKADLIFMSQVGDEVPYVLAQKGLYTQIGENLYFNNGVDYLKRYTSNGKAWNAEGYVTVFNKDAAKARMDYPKLADRSPDYVKMPIYHDGVSVGLYQQRGFTPLQEAANARVRELNKDANEYCLDFVDLFSAYNA